MQEAEEEKLLQQEMDDLYEREQKAEKDLTRMFMSIKVPVPEEQLEEEEDIEQAVENAEQEAEAFQEELEGLMREVRSEAQEHVLRMVEDDMHALHTTSLKSRDLEREAKEAELMYMKGVEEYQEYEQEEMEERQLEMLLKRQEEEERLAAEMAEAVRMEQLQMRKRDKRIALQEEEHDCAVGGGLLVSSPLEKFVREEEAACWAEGDVSVEESPDKGRSQTWGGIRRAAERKQAELSRELAERHDMFAERLRRKIESLHVEAEELRRQEWARGGCDFSQSLRLIEAASIIRDNFEEHISMLDEEYKGIAERRDLWPPEDTRLVKHPISAGAFRPQDKPDESEAPAMRPSTAPRRGRSARERDRAARQGRAMAPTGFSFGIRAVFEALDLERQGFITAACVPKAFDMLNLDVAEEDLVMLLEGEARWPYEKFEHMVLESIAEGISSSRAPSTSAGTTPIASWPNSRGVSRPGTAKSLPERV
mmetsp:Transcript_17333/g.42102  ORF Transcript_17333/g.42102 Transcript_17333/m.42102 type:complete len:481 (+) Transcript_17333:184-1626(+)